MAHAPEPASPVDLCLPGGRLNPAAVGWTRRPLHSAGPSGWGRRKRREDRGVVTPDHVVGLVASSLDYAGVRVPRSGGFRNRWCRRASPAGCRGGRCGGPSPR
ncbi:DUF2804 family protein [Streptomyces roseolus]